MKKGIKEVAENGKSVIILADNVTGKMLRRKILQKRQKQMFEEDLEMVRTKWAGIVKSEIEKQNGK